MPHRVGHLHGQLVGELSLRSSGNAFARHRPGLFFSAACNDADAHAGFGSRARRGRFVSLGGLRVLDGYGADRSRGGNACIRRSGDEQPGEELGWPAAAPASVVDAVELAVVLTARSLPKQRLMRFVYSTIRSYRRSWGVGSLSASRSFLNPPATIFR